MHLCTWTFHDNHVIAYFHIPFSLCIWSSKMVYCIQIRSKFLRWSHLCHLNNTDQEKKWRTMNKNYSYIFPHAYIMSMILRSFLWQQCVDIHTKIEKLWLIWFRLLATVVSTWCATFYLPHCTYNNLEVKVHVQIFESSTDFFIPCGPSSKNLKCWAKWLQWF